MNPIKRLTKHLKQNIAEYYTLLIIAVAIPSAVGAIVGQEWGILLSFVLQGVIGVLYIKGSSK